MRMKLLLGVMLFCVWLSGCLSSTENRDGRSVGNPSIDKDVIKEGGLVFVDGIREVMTPQAWNRLVDAQSGSESLALAGWFHDLIGRWSRSAMIKMNDDPPQKMAKHFADSKRERILYMRLGLTPTFSRSTLGNHEVAMLTIRHNETKRADRSTRPVLLFIQGATGRFNTGYKTYREFAKQLDADVIVFDYPSSIHNPTELADAITGAARERIAGDLTPDPGRLPSEPVRIEFNDEGQVEEISVQDSLVADLKGRKVAVYGLSMGAGLAVEVVANLRRGAGIQPLLVVDRGYKEVVPTLHHAARSYSAGLSRPSKKSLRSYVRYADVDHNPGSRWLEVNADPGKVLVFGYRKDKVVPDDNLLGYAPDAESGPEVHWLSRAEEGKTLRHQTQLNSAYVGDKHALQILKEFIDNND